MKTQQDMIAHAVTCIAMADQGRSKLTQEILEISGKSSSKVRHLMNNLCSMPSASYLEVGCWKGSTLISALYQNDIEAVGVDNWSEFGGPRAEFFENVKKYIPAARLQFFEKDCFTIDKTAFRSPINVYFYDGYHDPKDQEKAFTYFNDVLDDVFIAIVDDWNDPAVRRGTETGFKALNYQICHQVHLFSQNLWWNGLYVAVIQKR